MTSVVTLNNRAYYMDRGQFARSKAKDFRNESDTGERIPEERSVVANENWLRVWNDFSLGAGQELADDQESSPRRYRTSHNFDPFTPGELRLTHKTTEYNLQNTTGNLYSPRIIDDGRNVFVAFQDVFLPSMFWGNFDEGFAPVVVSGVSPQEGPNGFAALDLTTKFGEVIAVSMQGVYNIANGVAQHVAPEPYYGVEFANGRLLASFENVVYELDAGYRPTVIYQHPNPDWYWVGFEGSPKGFYAWGWGSADPFDGTSDYQEPSVYFFTIEEELGDIAAPYTVLPLPNGERVLDLLFYGGFVILSTNTGIRMAQVNELGYLVYGPALDIPNPHGIYGRGENIYFGFDNYIVGTNVDNTMDQGVHRGLGVIKLRELIDVLTPPYAMLYCMPGQTFYHNAPTQIAMDKDDVLFFGGYEDGLWCVDPRFYAIRGGIQFGFCNFGTNEQFRIFEAGIEAQSDYANTIKYDVGVRYLNNDPEAVGIGHWGGVKIINGTQGHVVSEYENADIMTARAELALNVSSVDFDYPTTGTTLYQAQYSSSPVAFYSEIMILPLLFAPWIRSDYGLDVSLDLDKEWDVLSDLMNNKRIVELVIADSKFRGFIQSLEMKEGTLTELSPYTETTFMTSEGEMCGIVLLTFHTLRNNL